MKLAALSLTNRRSHFTQGLALSHAPDWGGNSVRASATRRSKAPLAPNRLDSRFAPHMREVRESKPRFAAIYRRPCAGRGLFDALQLNFRKGPCLRRGEDPDGHPRLKANFEAERRPNSHTINLGTTYVCDPN